MPQDTLLPPGVVVRQLQQPAAAANGAANGNAGAADNVVSWEVKFRQVAYIVPGAAQPAIKKQHGGVFAASRLLINDRPAEEYPSRKIGCTLWGSLESSCKECGHCWSDRVAAAVGKGLMITLAMCVAAALISAAQGKGVQPACLPPQPKPKPWTVVVVTEHS
ncbi:hypothetical protein ABPG75_000077 [Micractinium tetrahymenae]